MYEWPSNHASISRIVTWRTSAQIGVLTRYIVQEYRDVTSHKRQRWAGSSAGTHSVLGLVLAVGAFVVAVAGDRLPDVAVARGRRTRRLARCGRQEGLRNHRHRTGVFGRAQGHRRRHLRSRDRDRRAHGGWLDGRGQPGTRASREGCLPDRLESRERCRAQERGGDPGEGYGGD